MTNNRPLSDIDAYIFARAFTGLPIDNLPNTPLTALLLEPLDLNQPDDIQLLRRILGTQRLAQIFQCDPQAPQPCAPQPDRIPALPGNISTLPLNPDTGRWLHDYTQWAAATANETPLSFHQAAALYLTAIAVGRRLFVRTPWQQRIFPNLYLMTVAVSTYYRKSAGLHLAQTVGQAAIPHMLMPQPGSPENFMAMLGGILPANFEHLTQPDRQRLLKGNRFAAQRGLLRDELSGLFKSMGKDYMAGMKELIMTLYDCPNYLDSNTNHKGLVVIHDAALSILGAATPAELSHALTNADWVNGNLARFGLITPEPDYAPRPPTLSDTQATGDALAQRLRTLHDKLPPPPEPDASGHTPTMIAWELEADIWQDCLAYERTLRQFTAPHAALDDRLRATYGRLHVQAIKIAILMAACDWADDPAPSERPVVRPDHWHQAQAITETWRASAHRLLDTLSQTYEVKLEDRVLRLLRSANEAMTVRAIYRALNAPRKPVVDALQALETDGLIAPITLPPSPGRRSDAYCVIDMTPNMTYDK